MPETRFTRVDDLDIAYQVVGPAAELDVVFVPGWVSHLEVMWELPEFAYFLDRLAAMGRLILFDKRGTGLSDRVAGTPTLEQRADDIAGVMDAAGSTRAAIAAWGEGAVIAAMFAAIQARTLIVYRTGNAMFAPEPARAAAKLIPEARYVEVPGPDSLPYVGDADAVLNVIQEFLTGAQATPDLDRSLATVMFTDIVGSTHKADQLGDRGWRYLLDEHHARIRRLLDRFRGTEVDTAGDGFFATFDGPARAIRCACAARDAVREIGIEIRAGLHTGEVERRGTAATGLAVHVGARVAGLARAGEVLVTNTVHTLVLGSGIGFADRGLYTLKGVPDQWQLFAVEHA
jgi:class 3 adenylate cyclase